jgi:hypothetical protein
MISARDLEAIARCEAQLAARTSLEKNIDMLERKLSSIPYGSLRPPTPAACLYCGVPHDKPNCPRCGAAK